MPDEPPKDSILNSTKKLLNMGPEYDAFDMDIIMHINSVFTSLAQMGVGPRVPFVIEDASTPWSAFIDQTPGLASVKSYMANKVRLMFDPPTSAAGITAVENICKEFEWRLNVGSETP